MIADEGSLTRLAGLAQGGDKQAYSALLGAARGWLLRYLRRRVTPCQLDDLVQDTLLSVHRKLASYDPSRPFTPWLAAIARYRFVDHLRLVYRRAEDELNTDFHADDPDEPAMTARISLERLRVAGLRLLASAERAQAIAECYSRPSAAWMRCEVVHLLCWPRNASSVFGVIVTGSRSTRGAICVLGSLMVF